MAKYKIAWVRLSKEYHEAIVDAVDEDDAQRMYDEGDLWDQQPEVHILDEHSVTIDEVSNLTD